MPVRVNAADLMSVKAAAEYIGCSKNAVQGYCARRLLRTYRRLGRGRGKPVMVFREDVVALRRRYDAEANHPG